MPKKYAAAHYHDLTFYNKTMSCKTYLTAFTGLTMQSNTLHSFKRTHIQQVFTAYHIEKNEHTLNSYVDIKTLLCNIFFSNDYW